MISLMKGSRQNSYINKTENPHILCCLEWVFITVLYRMRRMNCLSLIAVLCTRIECCLWRSIRCCEHDHL